MTIEEIKEWRKDNLKFDRGIDTADIKFEIIDTLLAEVERLNSVDHYACALCPDVAQARQEAAREILNDRLIIAYIAPDGIVHKQLMKKYGLEG